MAPSWAGACPGRTRTPGARRVGTMAVVSEGANSVPLCDICKTGRAPFLRYGNF